jgi:hypothetical protein
MVIWRGVENEIRRTGMFGLQLLGRRNWWSHWPLKWLHGRIGLGE